MSCHRGSAPVKARREGGTGAGSGELRGEQGSGSLTAAGDPPRCPSTSRRGQPWPWLVSSLGRVLGQEHAAVEKHGPPGPGEFKQVAART